DPHFWFDPLRVKKAVWDISARLSVLDPSGAETYRSNAESYNARLDELHAWTVEAVGRIPEERRLLASSHDSMGYFANEYGFKVLGAILSTATEAEPSADDIAQLSLKIEEYGVPAVFVETTINDRLAAAVASESGAKIVSLHTESLGSEDSGAETYIEMIRNNVTRIVEALE
ncbi:MAG: metal ABC transporter substrate-binding protein, partial [Dehalococcoidia bacterium]|nr:metal ABC transporter substrate-binding protein [Dehalococcoidia bacterium]